MLIKRELENVKIVLTGGGNVFFVEGRQYIVAIVDSRSSLQTATADGSVHIFL